MARLSHSDLQGLLSFVRQVDSFPDVESLRGGMLPALAELEKFDTAAYHEVDVESGDTWWLIEPHDAEGRAHHDVFVRWGGQHPIAVKRPRHP